MAGLSMGGMQTFQIGPQHLDLFSYLGMFSGTPMAQAQAQVDAVAAQGAAFTAKCTCCGSGSARRKPIFTPGRRKCGPSWRRPAFTRAITNRPGRRTNSRRGGGACTSSRRCSSARPGRRKKRRENDDAFHTTHSLKQSSLAGAGVRAALAIPVVLKAARSAPSAPVADTTLGKLRGRTEDGIQVFRGIPYGADTSGKNRFMPPRKPSPWKGHRDASHWGHVAPQPLPERQLRLHAGGAVGHPAGRQGRRLPGFECLDAGH